MPRNAHYNREGRRSGGSKKTPIFVPKQKDPKYISILCAFGRHSMCIQKNDQGVCVCDCHKEC